jgi:hypothetical protein
MKFNSALFLFSFSPSSYGAFAFTMSASSSHSPLSTNRHHATQRKITSCSSLSVNKETEDAFSAFAESLDEDDLFNDNEGSSNSNAFEDSNGDDMYNQKTWQENVEALLDPTTPLAKRQILLTDLLNSNENIREDVLTALRERKVCIMNEFYHFLRIEK